MFYQFIKRIVDIFGAVVGLLILAPLFPFIAIAIKIESDGPIVIKLDRVSSGKTIGAYKFRSMIKDAQEKKKALISLNERKDGPFFKIRNDPRLTGAGKILRKFRLDEFPQLLNVLRGELSLVGPRPHEPEETNKYPDKYKYLISKKIGSYGPFAG